VRELDILGSNSYSQEDVAKSVAYAASGDIAPVVSHTFSLEKLGEAETLMEERGFFGKIVMTP
jgi:D-arabinose 1-dehydrogenase-like Zn-dependent alcohol dehydrogenase